MEMFTLIFFVLTLLVAALIVTQTIRRDLKSQERTAIDTRRGSTHAPHDPARHALHSPSLQHHAHKSPPRTL